MWGKTYSRRTKKFKANKD
jgi:hypothetical protein